MAEPRVKIFLSHKTVTDANRAVSTLARELEAISNGDLGVFVAGDDIRAGQSWRSVIGDELSTANLLVLLFTEPHLSWDWCLYEVGLFTRMDKVVGDQDRHPPIVCIFPPGAMVPTPIEHIQGIPATLDELTDFLERLYTTTDFFCDLDPPEPIRDTVDDGIVLRLANSVMELYPTPAIGKYYPCHRVVLTVPEDVELRDASSLCTAHVEATDHTLYRLFGKSARNANWGALIDHLQPGTNRRWLRELFEVIMRATNGERFEPITSTFLGWENSIYCPEVYQVVAAPDPHRRPDEPWQLRPRSVTLVFDKVMAPSVVGDAVFNLIRANFRFREEVFDRFANLSDQLDRADADEQDVLFERLKESMGVIRHEADIHGFFDPMTLKAAYGETYDDELARLEERWRLEEAELTKNIDRRAVADISRSLDKMAAINWSFSMRAAERHQTLLEAQADAHPETVDVR